MEFLVGFAQVGADGVDADLQAVGNFLIHGALGEVVEQGPIAALGHSVANRPCYVE